MKIQKIIYGIAAVAITGLGSCKDSFLDEQMYSSYSVDIEDVEAKVIGLHRQFAELWGWSDSQGFVGCFQDGTDVGAPGDVEGVETPFYQYASLNSENAGVGHLWRYLYKIINNANIIILSDLATPTEKAEAEFFRAYSYNMLVTFWGKVPLVTQTISKPKTDYVREDISKIDALIVSDLKDAVANLPEVDKTVTESRINKDCARILAAEAYLRMGKYKEAEDIVSPVIDEGNYSLIQKRYGKFLSDAGDYYSDMFRWGNQRRSQNNTEGIWVFQMEYNKTVSGGTISAPQQRRNWVAAFHKIEGMVNADSLGGRGNGRLRLSNYVKYGLYQEGDIRNSNYNIRRNLWYNKPDWTGEYYIDADGFRVDVSEEDEKAGKTEGLTKISVKTGDLVHCRKQDTLNVLYPHCTKWGAYDPTEDFGWAMVKDWPLMRLADAYLLRAEARVMQDNTQGAADDINVLRDRAFKEYREKEDGDPQAGIVSASDMTLDFILDERIRELVGEENRRYTLCRTKKLAERVKMIMEKCPEGVDSKQITGFDENIHTLLPIPLSEIDLNKDDVIEQNPGYK